MRKDMSLFYSKLHDPSADQPIELRKFTVQIRITLFEELVLMPRAHSAAGALPVALVEPVHDIHAFDDPAEGREAIAILALHAVVGADVDLGDARAWSCHGEGERAAHIAGALLIVWKLRSAPNLR